MSFDTTKIAAASWYMDERFPIGPAYGTSLVGMINNEGYTIQPFIPEASGLPSLLRIAGGNGNWQMTVNFEIWCDGQLAAKKIVETVGFNQYSQNGYVFNLSFDDVPDRKPIQEGKPCELRIQTISTSINYTSFGVQIRGNAEHIAGQMGNITLVGHPSVKLCCLFMDLTVI